MPYTRDIHVCVQLHIGDVSFFIPDGEHFLTFGATSWARLCSLALICRPLVDLLLAQVTKKCSCDQDG